MDTLIAIVAADSELSSAFAIQRNEAIVPALHKIYTRKQIDALRDELIAKHGDHCAVCKKPSSAFKKRLSVDHNHKTGKVRGLLCYRCNKFLVGRQTIESACKLLDYLVTYDLPLGDT